MRYSYAWDATPKGLGRIGGEDGGAWGDQYVRLRGIALQSVEIEGLKALIDVRDADDLRFRVFMMTPAGTKARIHEPTAFSGRLWWGEKAQALFRAHIRASRRGRRSADELTKDSPYVMTEKGRLTGASVAGLVVGAMGVFVFGTALRHWLRERRASITTEARRTRRTSTGEVG
jgi:hypothetical protein